MDAMMNMQSWRTIL